MIMLTKVGKVFFGKEIGNIKWQIEEIDEVIEAGGAIIIVDSLSDLTRLGIKIGKVIMTD